MLEPSVHIFYERLAVYVSIYIIVTCLLLLNGKLNKKWTKYVLYSFIMIAGITIYVDGVMFLGSW